MMSKSEWTARWQILMEAIAKKENITVTDDDFSKLAEKEAPLIGLSVDKLIQYYKDSGRENVLLEDKVIEFLQAHNNIKEVTPEEYEKSNKLNK
jgi:trigger factor